MQNDEIIGLLELTGRLLDLHDENPFKIKAYTQAVFALEKVAVPLAGLSAAQLAALDGIGRAVAEKIVLLNTEGTFPELHDLLARTPEGVVEMLDIKGIGPKKVKALWKELGVDTPDALLEACEQNRVAGLKGFGAKTQENIRQALQFRQASRGKLLYAAAEPLAAWLLEQLAALGLPAALTGQVARKNEVIDQIQAVAATDRPEAVHRRLDALPELEAAPETAPFAWRGRLAASGVPVEVRLVPPPAFAAQVFVHTAAPAHLRHRTAAGASLLQTALAGPHADDHAIYAAAGLPYIVPEMRDDATAFAWSLNHTPADLVTTADLTGILHTHSTYSDGKHTLEEMAVYCQSLGYQYLGISDHSQSAFYANGLSEDRVRRQHAEIDDLNRRLAPFRVFKGIESDILADGSLDYPDEVLARFDFVVASIHANLKMDQEKATRRLIRAVEHPHTTLLGHPTGRLLLRREGYPINHRRVIDACAANGVLIELNANPWRLDLDWHWLPYCLEKGVRISINPDAHDKAGLHHVAYGVHVARKGGLLRAMTFNTLPLAEVAAHFNSRR